MPPDIEDHGGPGCACPNLCLLENCQMGELVSLLRRGKFYNWKDERSDLHVQAAARIEALEAHIEALEKERPCNGMIIADGKGGVTPFCNLKHRVESLEAVLLRLVDGTGGEDDDIIAVLKLLSTI